MMVKHTERYARSNPKVIRENPRDELEEAFAEEEAEREASLILDKYSKDPNFRRRLVVKLTDKELAATKRTLKSISSTTTEI